jgi:glycosyltransferase involved in cell wall biosynthesis
VKFAVVNNCVPFVSGGAEHLATALVSKLIEYGHQAILVRIPFRWEPPSKIVECMLACRLMRLPNVDRMIGLKFPAYYLPHPDKMLWLLHQFRQAYDFWGTPFQGLPDTPEAAEIREAIIRTDNAFLTQVGKIYTNSHVTSGRLKRFNNIDSEVLFPPLLDTRHFHTASYDNFIFYPSRITASKRQRLVVESMQYVRTGVRLIVAGKAEAAEDLHEIEDIVRRHRLEGRVEILSRFIGEQEKADLFSRALGCAYVPYDEESYGYVTLESFHSRKPVITCTDSGGTDVVVQDGITGYVVAPQPRAIADAMDKLYDDKAAARRMGEAGHDLIQKLNITWDRVVEAFTR